jgi:hypothetical protein
MNNNYTDTQLKLLLAKMLPEKLCWVIEDSPATLCRRNSVVPVLDTELLDLCWWVEEELGLFERSKYAWNLLCALIADSFEFGNNCFSISWRQLFHVTHATWQQRVIALAKVKGIEIV